MMSDNIDGLAKELYDQIVQDIESTIHDNNGHYQEIADQQTIKPVTETGHEIVFDIKGMVFAENEKGQLTQTKEVVQKTYHIPVPPHLSYSAYCEQFFALFEKILADSAKQTNKEFNYEPN